MTPSSPPTSAPLATLPYRPRWSLVLLPAGFFGACALGAAHMLRAEGGILPLVLLLLSLGFVGLSAFTAVMRVARPQVVEVHAHGLRLPEGAWWRGRSRFVPLAGVRGLTRTELSGQRFVTLSTDDGPVSLNRAMLADDTTFEQLVAFVQGARWGAAPAPQAPTAPILGPAWVDRTAGRLVLKVGALLSFCGGPLRLTDALAPTLGTDPAFAVALTPIVLVLFGSFALAEEAPGAVARGLQHLGAVAAVAVAGLSVWAWVGVARGPARADDGLVLFGSAVGLALCGVYLWAHRRAAASRPTR